MTMIYGPPLYVLSEKLADISKAWVSRGFTKLVKDLEEKLPGYGFDVPNVVYGGCRMHGAKMIVRVGCDGEEKRSYHVSLNQPPFRKVNLNVIALNGGHAEEVKQDIEGIISELQGKNK